jgi:hypothetical protein
MRSTSEGGNSKRDMKKMKYPREILRDQKEVVTFKLSKKLCNC